MTKIIINIIYYVGLIAAAILDFQNIQLYFVIAFLLIQIVFIVSEYIVTNRVIVSEISLVKKNYPFVLGDLFFAIGGIIVLHTGVNLFFRFLDLEYLLTLISIGIISAIIQFVIIRGKNTPTLLIDKNSLLINDLVLKTYDLEQLKSITLDGFDEVYIARFAGTRKVKIKQDDYKAEDLSNFIAAMASRSKTTVLLPGNTGDELNAATGIVAGTPGH
jgi:hypothetical protein